MQSDRSRKDYQAFYDNIEPEDSCLGVFRLSVSAWIISILQFIYSSLSLIFLINQDYNIVISNILELLHYSQDMFLDMIGITAAAILAVGNCL